VIGLHVCPDLVRCMACSAVLHRADFQDSLMNLNATPSRPMWILFTDEQPTLPVYAGAQLHGDLHWRAQIRPADLRHHARRDDEASRGVEVGARERIGSAKSNFKLN
jgi:hypothetical protein